MANKADDFQKLIDRIEKTNNTFHGILSRDPRQLVITPDFKSKIDSIIGRNERLLKKLMSKEFEIAGVGLEKAGKSTVSNALLGVNILPAKAERCTFVRTEIRAGIENRAEVEFYSPEEFNRNFASLLRELGYKDCTLSEFSWDDFREFWEGVEQKDPSKYREFTCTTVPDLEAMASNKGDILPYLGTGTRSFSKEEIRTSDFRKFITGFKAVGEDGYSVRGAFTYAVKGVTLRSKDIAADMKTAVVLDVPGIDSSSHPYREQIEKALGSADAIIFVTNVGCRPNLCDYQVRVLRKCEADCDGIMLSDKTIVFGNKLDMAGTRDNASKNMDVLKNEVTRCYQIARPDRVIFGSAAAYMMEEKLGMAVPAERADAIVRNTKLFNNGSTGIPELKKVLRDYYDNDRLGAIECRASGNEKQGRKILGEIMEKGKSSEVADAELLSEIKDALAKI